MKIWKATFILSVALFFSSPNTLFAHPGRTASDGCHYCRTNCASWGEVQGARHCHGGYSPPSTYTAPTATPLPSLAPTPHPTSTPTPKPTPTLSPSPKSSPEVQGEQTSKPTQSPSSQVSPNSSSGNTFSQFLGWTGVAFFAYLIYKNRKNKKLEKKGGEKE